MQIQILGTAAAEGWPAIFCACEPCQRARRAGGRSLRSRSSILVDQTVKVDLNADVWHHSMSFGLDFSRLEHLAVTHSHNDHLSLGELEYLRDPFAHNRASETLQVWCSSDVADIIRKAYPDTGRLGVQLNEVRPFQTCMLGTLPATPVRAVHRKEETCLNWMFGPPERAVLYTCDTGPYEEDTWDYLAGVKLQLIISECTYGTGPSFGGHLSLDDVRALRDRLEKSGSLTADCRIVLTHFSHNSGLLHEELEEAVKADGFEIAWDGMLLETAG